MDRSFLLLAAALLLAGCASAPTQTVTVPVAPAAPENMVPPAEMPPSGEIQPVMPETGPVMSDNRAVIALLDRSRLDNAGGRRDAAGVSLERALRIEPRNPWLWHELARLRLAEGLYAQAITLARKSISFARHDKRLQALDWRLIGDARVAQGDAVGAEQAYRQAEALDPPVPAEGMLN